MVANINQKIGKIAEETSFSLALFTFSIHCFLFYTKREERSPF